MLNKRKKQIRFIQLVLQILNISRASLNNSIIQEKLN